MKKTIVRNIDSKGRIVIPHEIRKAEGLLAGDAFEIEAVKNNGIYLRKYPAAHNPTETGYRKQPGGLPGDEIKPNYEMEEK